MWLQCPVEELLTALRAHHQTVRSSATKPAFATLYQERLPFYELADYRVESNIEPLRVVEQIVALGIFPKVTA